MSTKQDLRQSLYRGLLGQIATVSNQTADHLIAAVNNQLIPLLRMDANTASRVINIGSGDLTDAETNRRRAIPHVGATYIQFTSGTVTFPASSGGNIVCSPGNNSILTLGVGQFSAVLIYLDASGALNALPGTGNAVLSTAIVNLPPSPGSTLPLGFVVVHNVGGVIQNIAQSDIAQFAAGTGGSGSGNVKATFLDPVNTVLPTGVSVVIDGVAGANGDTVLYTKLASGNNQIYTLSGVGTAIAWTAQRAFNGAFLPTDGDAVRIQKGLAFQEQLSVFDGTLFKVNDVIRQFDGVSGNFWEQSSLKTLTLVNNATTNVFTVTYSGSENIIMKYSVNRAGIKELGHLLITTNGTDAKVAKAVNYTGDPGITFTATISLGNLVLNAAATNTGSASTLKYFVERWSDQVGGPTGIPNYNTTPPSGVVPAAGSLNEVQYNGPGGLLAAESRFMWDPTLGALNLNGLRIGALSPAIILADNQIAPVAAITYATANFRYAVIEYSIDRGSLQRIGTLKLMNDASTVTLQDEKMETLPTGITFTAVVSGPNVEIQYTSTSTGQTGSLKFSMRSWT